MILCWVNQKFQLREKNYIQPVFLKLHPGSLCHSELIPDEGQPKTSTSLYFQALGPFFLGSSSLPSLTPILGSLPGFGLCSGFSMLDMECAWGSLARGRFAGLSSSLPVNTQIILVGAGGRGSSCMMNCLRLDFYELTTFSENHAASSLS